MIGKTILRLGLALGILAPALSPCNAVAQGAGQKPPAIARLMAGTDSLAPDGQAALGLAIDLAPGWKTYWRSPGEGGVAPEFDWSASTNLKSAEVGFPVPERQVVGGVTSIVYPASVILPVTVAAKDPKQPLRLSLVFRYGVCHDICVPREDRLSFELQPGNGVPSASAPAIEAARAQVPLPFAQAGLTLKRAWTTPGPKPTLKLSIEAAEPLTPSDILVEGPETVWFEQPQMAVPDTAPGARGGTVLAVVPLGPAGAPDLLAGHTLTITVLAGARSAETQVTLPK